MRGRRLSRHRGPWPLRVRLTAAVGAVTAVVLLGTGALVFVEFARGLDSRTDLELKERAASLTALAQRVPERRLLGVSGESLAQLFGPAGDLRESTLALGRQALLTPAEVQAATDRPRLATMKTVAGTDDGARVLAFPIRGGAVMAVAEGRDAREQELARLALFLVVGLPVALLLATFTGYQVAGAALRPVELIRARAAAIGEDEPEGRLPQPGTGDELDRLTTTLNDLLARRAEALERERRIVSDASHELRTPISVLRTRLDVALRREPEAEELGRVLHEAHGDAQRLARLADDLLVLARADQGRLPLRFEPLDVQDVLEGAVERHRVEADRDGRHLQVSVDIDGGAVILADPDRLAQALDNLVVNALRYGEGVVDLAARAPGATMIELSVADRGPGFGDDLLPRAFDRFAQGTDHGRAGGAGLGLALVDALARASGGSVRAANRTGGGAEVTLSVPAA